MNDFIDKVGKDYMKSAIDQIVNNLLPFNEGDMKCMQKHMLKERNREMLKRALKTIHEQPYKRYFFESKL